MRLHYGKALRSDDRTPGAVPVVGSAGRFAWHDRGNSTTAPATIVVGRKGTAGSVTLIRGPAWVTDTAYWAEPLAPVELTFLYLLLQYADLPAVCAQTGVPGLNRDRAYGIQVALPSPDEQRRIADVFDALDNALGVARQLGARAVYNELLSSLMAEEGQPLRAALAHNDEVERVQPDGQYRLVGVLRSGSGFIDRGVTRGYELSYTNLHALSRNQLVYRRLTAWEGPISVTSDAEVEGWVSNEFPVFDVKDDVLLPELLRHMCRWPGLWDRMRHRLTGSVQRRKRLSPDQLLEVPVAIPSRDDQHKWLGILDAAWTLVDAESRTVARLHALRTHLLTVLLSGEHEIPASYDALMDGGPV